MRAELTVKRIEKAKPAPKGKRVEIWDALVPGLALRVTDKGGKSFTFMRRVGGDLRRWTLGEWLPDAEAEKFGSLAWARNEARAKLAQIAEGLDPTEVEAQRKAADIAAKEAADREAAERARAAIAAEQFTVRALGEEFIREHLEKVRGGRYGRETGNVFRSDVIAAWGDRQVSSIRRSDVRKLLAEIEERGGPIAANRRQAAISKFFSWCLDSYEETETGLVANPVSRLPRRGTETARDRLLSDAELRVIWKAAERMAGPYADMVRLLMLTAQRRGECAGLAMPEVNEARAEWIMAGDRTKNGLPHLVPLSADAVALVKSARARVKKQAETLEIEPSEHVFSHDAGRTAVGGFSKFRRVLAEKVAKVVAEERAAGAKELKVEAFRLHDIRRTVATGLASLGIERETVGAILNHAAAGVTAKHYELYDRAAEKRAALDRWAKHLAGIVTGKPAGNVVAIKGRARRGRAAQ